MHTHHLSSLSDQLSGMPQGISHKLHRGPTNSDSRVPFFCTKDGQSLQGKSVRVHVHACLLVCLLESEGGGEGGYSTIFAHSFADNVTAPYACC